MDSISHGTPQRIPRNHNIMKRLLFIATSLILCYSISAQDFRKASWGDSKATVEASESVDEWEEYSDGIYEVMVFETLIVGINAYVGFMFVDNKLVRTAYIFNENHMLNNNLYIDEFNRVDELLQSKYGKGDKEEIWKNDVFKNDASFHGNAIEMGYYEIFGYWEIPGKTTIVHFLKAGENDIDHVVQYNSIGLEDHLKEAEMDVF